MADQEQKERPSAGKTTPQPAPEVTGNSSTLSGEPLKDLSERASEPPPDPGSAVAAAAKGERLNQAGQSEALQWFLKATPDKAEEERKVLKLNFGTSKEPEWVEWTIKPVQLDTMRRIRTEAGNTRAARATGQVDEYRVNLEIVVAGTVDPDVREAARLLHAQGALPTNDAAAAVRIRFQNKPGYIAQISGEIMSLSGFNDDDVTEAEAVDAAGNS
jgi:Phage XkdN-like tail assembly chaperone protein, TAC